MWLLYPSLRLFLIFYTFKIFHDLKDISKSTIIFPLERLSKCKVLMLSALMDLDFQCISRARLRLSLGKSTLECTPLECPLETSSSKQL